MLVMPKGYKFWYTENGKNKIKKDAPEWAKKEFNEYQEKLKMIGKPKEDGAATFY